MFRSIKQAATELRDVVLVLNRLADTVQEGLGGVSVALQLADRVSDLEGQLHAVLAEAEGLVTRAESKLAAARGAEERARGMKNRAEDLARTVAGDEESEEPIDQWLAQLSAGNGVGGPEGGVPPVRNSVENLTGKDRARAAKWGLI